LQLAIAIADHREVTILPVSQVTPAQTIKSDSYRPS